MDDYRRRGGRFNSGTTYTLNEFCVASNHDPDHNTSQHATHGKSCWETIAAHPKRPAIAPGGLPLSLPPPVHNVTVRTNGCQGLRAMIVTDRSSSMEGDRLDNTQQGATLFVELLGNGDAVGLASFSDSASVDFPLTLLANQEAKAAAVSAISSLSADGSTNIGDGLLAGLSQLTAQPQCSCKDIIILLTDGEHTTGTPPEATIPALQQAKVSVFVVLIGNDADAVDQGTMANIAAQTGGKLIAASDPNSLIGLFAVLEAEANDDGPAVYSPKQVSSGEVQEVPVSIEAGATSATFGVIIADENDQITVSLQSPSGVTITETNTVSNLKKSLAANDSNASLISGPKSRIFRVNAPEAGTWKIIITAGAVTTGKLEALAFSDHDGVQLNASVKKERLAQSEAAEIHATLSFKGEAVTGATVTGTVTRPDQSQVPITLFDDGLAAHADLKAGDGVYSARFSSYVGRETYSVDLTAVSSNGITYAGESLFSDQPSSAHPVPAFTRMGKTAFVVVLGRDVKLRKDVSLTDTAPVLERDLHIDGLQRGCASIPICESD